jgi:hypothetical protein
MPEFDRAVGFALASTMLVASMIYLLVKAAISGLIVAVVNEVARRYPGEDPGLGSRAKKNA